MVSMLLKILVSVVVQGLVFHAYPAKGQLTDYRVAHNQGNIQLTIEPGRWGEMWWSPGRYIPQYDPITGDSVYGSGYPRGSGYYFMTEDLIIGAVRESDTMASWFLSSDYMAPGSFWRVGSNDRASQYYSPSARSILDWETKVIDTSVARIEWWGWERGFPVPLEMIGTQRSMAWSGSLVDDFVLIDYEFTNVGDKPLNDVWVGCRLLSYYETQEFGPIDDLTGYLQDYPSPDGCSFRDKLNIAYCMDNDGDPVNGAFTRKSRRGVVGVTMLGCSIEEPEFNYTWLVWDDATSEDWGPRRRPTETEPFRSFNPYFAWPGSYRNLYYMLSHPHIAYDQMFAGVDHMGWMPPWKYGSVIASGSHFWAYYTFGPFDIPVKDKISFTIAVVGGDNVHNDPTIKFNPQNPQYFYDQLDFSELAQNARWAQWVYDNPGVDTDSDGYFGEFRVCEGDTTWYKGDGVPDFRGNSPPPIPFTRYETEPGRIIVRWNGFLSETTKDIFSGLVDFEGYRVYCGLDNRRTSLSLLSSYDKENWFRLKYHQLGVGNGRWINDDPPYSLDSLRIIHHDPDLNPDRYTRDRPLFEGDSAFYFAPVDANLADLSSITGIHKVYPDATNPGKDSLLWTESDITTEHGRRLPKYYEYEYIIENLLPTVPYFVAVTVFDFGYAGGRGNLPPDETNPLSNCTEVYAQTSSEVVEQENLDVIVYPNPYRVDANYDELGYENRKGNIIPDRARLIHFSNLPPVCRISIFSLDGDLVGTINHNYPDGGPEAMHDWWNLVSRSGLAVESGLYYWVVESSTRTQMGKLVILK